MRENKKKTLNTCFLVPDNPIHVQLFDGLPKNRTKKSSYDLTDLWTYFVTSTKVRSILESIGVVLSRSEREGLCLQVLLESRSFREEERRTIISLVEEHGIEVVLYAIDCFAQTDWERALKAFDDVPSFTLVALYISEGRRALKEANKF